MSQPAPVERSAERAWERARELLLAKFGPHAFRLGVEPLRFAAAHGSEVQLTASDPAAAGWMQRHHPGALEEAMREATFPCRIRIACEGRGQGELFPGDPTRRRRPIRAGGLLPRHTFATFVVGGSNQFAHAACKAVASQPGRHYNPLFLYGGVGLGKTHLANAIGHEIVAREPEARVACVSAETFMTKLITALRRDRMEEFKSLFRRLDVLIIDDVQSLTNRERTQEEFFHTFNALHESRRQIVLTSDKVPRDIPGLEERLRNRFEWGLIADIQPPDMETRVAILEKKAELEGLDLPREVAIYLASQVDSNVRELEGCLRRLAATASLSKTGITVEVARTALKDLLRSTRSATIDTVQRAVCAHFGLRLGDLLSHRRTRSVALPRQVAMYLARKLTAESFPAIGERFGGRDHSTVMHAQKVIIERMAEDESLRSAVERIERAAQSPQ
jgi:chromosomal replication initiator protein